MEDFMEMSAIKHCYAGGHTSIGFYSLINDAIQDLERIYTIFGASSSLKSKLILQLGERLHQKGYNIDYLHALNDIEAVEGLIVPELKLGIIDGNSEHKLDSHYPGIRDRYICFDEYWIRPLLNKYREEIIYLNSKIKSKLKQVYSEYGKARKVHEQKEKIYIAAMDFSRANQVSDRLCKEIFANPDFTRNAQSERHFFLGASTGEGPKNFIDNITENCSKRYIIKGRSGSGKSTIMRKIAKIARDRGLGVEYYHCSFDPISLDMIVIPDLSVAVMDGTSPHVIEPSRPNDEVVDMFTLTIDPHVEIEYEEELRRLNHHYRSHMQEATSLLREVKTVTDLLDQIYLGCINQNEYMKAASKWVDEIIMLSEND